VISILVLFAIMIFPLQTVYGQAPVKDYSKEWKKVEDLVNKQLPQSAITEIKKIYTLAKNEKQQAQQIKALVYMIALQEEIREDNKALGLIEMEKEIASSKEPVTSILKSIQAGMYWNYYQQNRWQLFDRTKTVDFRKDDIATWHAEDFHNKISSLYLQSLKEEKLLKQTKLEAFRAILQKGNTRHLRPTLFDLLANTALAYFQNDERDIARPAYAFEISQATAFDPADSFVNRKFTTQDSLSLQHKALLLYQKLIGFHLRDTTPEALIDIDLQRLEYVRAKSVHPEKEQLYYNSLRQIVNIYPNLPGAAQAWYKMAAWLA
jgi:hypothetical protein